MWGLMGPWERKGEERRKGALFWLLSGRCVEDTEHKLGERTEWKVAEASGCTWSPRERKGREEPAARAQPWRALVFKRWPGRRSRGGRGGGGPGSEVLEVQRCGVRRKWSLRSHGAGTPRSEVC